MRSQLLGALVSGIGGHKLLGGSHAAHFLLDGGALVLDTGQSVRLVGIEAPAAPYKDREGDPGYEDAMRLLEDRCSAAKWSCAMAA